MCKTYNSYPPFRVVRENLSKTDIQIYFLDWPWCSFRRFLLRISYSPDYSSF